MTWIGSEWTYANGQRRLKLPEPKLVDFTDEPADDGMSHFDRTYPWPAVPMAESDRRALEIVKRVDPDALTDVDPNAPAF